jgi:hypothetical protein
MSTAFVIQSREAAGELRFVANAGQLFVFAGDAICPELADPPRLNLHILKTENV